MAESNISDSDILNKRKEMEPCEEPEPEELSESSDSEGYISYDDYEAARAAWRAEYALNDPDMERYKQEVVAYEGFYLTDCQALSKKTRLALVPCLPAREEAVKLYSFYANLAINRFYETEGESLEFKELLRANWSICGPFLFYLTFAATNGKFYETKLSVLNMEIVEFFFLREAKHYPNLGPLSPPSSGSSSKGSN